MSAAAGSRAGTLARAWSFVAGPGRAWADLGQARVAPGVCARHLALLCMLPATGWVLGLLLYPRDGAPVMHGLADAAALCALTWLLCLAQAGLLAFAWCLVAPLYGAARDARRMFAVATYGSTPLLLGGLLLAWPPLMPALLLALLHACVAWREGLRVHAGLRAGDATEAVAIGGLLTAIMSAIGGAIAERLETIIITAT